MSDELDAGLRRAADLFNVGEYHAAHEVLDELWEHAPRADGDFVKGLIQAAVALHHYQRGNTDGARKLYSGHRQYLGPYLPAYRGLDVARFLAQMQATLLPVVRAASGPAPSYEAASKPRLDFSHEK